MKRYLALQILATHQDQIKQIFKVKTLAIFGSVARDEAQANSDIDLLVEFTQPVGLFTFLRLHRYLENILGTAVDLGTPDSLKSYLKETVLKEAIYAIEGLAK